MPRRILHVVTNVAHYTDPSIPTGLWLSELTHAYQVFAEKGCEQRLVSPKGGVCPLEPRSLKWPFLDATAKAWLADKDRMALLAETARPDQIDAKDFDAIYFTGGHAVMWDFPDAVELQCITREIFEQGGVVSSVCHGYCGLLNTKLSDGALLVAGRRLTGFSWTEEWLAGVAKEVPYNAERDETARRPLRKSLAAVHLEGRHRRTARDGSKSTIRQSHRPARCGASVNTFDRQTIRVNSGIV